MPTPTTETRFPSRTGDWVGTNRADAAFLGACARYAAELLSAATASRRGRLGGPERDLLQQALVLGYLLETCRSDAEAWQRLRRLGQGTGGVGAAARQLRTLPSGGRLRPTVGSLGGPVLCEGGQQARAWSAMGGALGMDLGLWLLTGLVSLTGTVTLVRYTLAMVGG